MPELLTLSKTPQKPLKVAGFKSEAPTGFMSEHWPTSNRNHWPACVGIHTSKLCGTEWPIGPGYLASSLIKSSGSSLAAGEIGTRHSAQ
jgi:hypothetical protein